MSGDTNTSLSLLSASCEQSVDSNLLCTDMGSSMPFCSRPSPLLFVLGLTVVCVPFFSFIGFTAIVGFAAIGGLFVVSFFLSLIFLG